MYMLPEIMPVVETAALCSLVNFLHYYLRSDALICIILSSVAWLRCSLVAMLRP